MILKLRINCQIVWSNTTSRSAPQPSNYTRIDTRHARGNLEKFIRIRVQFKQSTHLSCSSLNLLHFQCLIPPQFALIEWLKCVMHISSEESKVRPVFTWIIPKIILLLATDYSEIKPPKSSCCVRGRVNFLVRAILRKCSMSGSIKSSWCN